jgi:WD40 repeat protein
MTQDYSSNQSLTLFISYSRKDEAFAEELVAGLKAAGFQPYLDKRDIAAGEQWESRLSRLIEAAGTVVFVISPDSVGSQRCGWEIERTASLRKRLIPVLWRDVEDSLVPPLLRRLNYIFFNRPHSFGPSLEALSVALRTDLDWIREHTRLGELSLRWQGRGRIDALLLRGEELVGAKDWLNQQPPYAPEPTDLLLEFISESSIAEIRRTNAERRNLDEIAAAQQQRAHALKAAEEALAKEARAQEQRKALRRAGFAGLTVALLLLSALSLITLRSYGEADHDFSLALLATADRLLIEEKPTRSLVVAGSLQHESQLRKFLHSVGVAGNSPDEAVRIESIARIARPASIAPLITRVGTSPATALSFSDRTALLAVGYNSGLVEIFSPSGQTRPLHLEGHSGRIWAAKFANSGTSVASASTKEAIVWDLERKTGKMLCNGKSEILDVAFHPNGREVAWSMRSGQIAIWDLDSGETKMFQEHRARALALDFSPDGTRLASAGDDGAIRIRDTGNWTLIREISTHRLDIEGISFSQDGKRLATAALAGPADVWRLDVEEGQAVDGVQLAAPVDKRWRIRFSGNGKWLALTSWQGTIRVWDAPTLNYMGTVDSNDTRINDVTFSSKDSHLITASESGLVRFWPLQTLKPMFYTIPNDPRETLNGKYSPDGKSFVAGGKDGIATLFDVSDDGRITRKCEFSHENWVFSTAFSHDSRILYSVGPKEGGIDGDVIKIWDTSTCLPVRSRTPIEPAFVVRLAASPVDGRLAWATRQGDIWVGDLNNAAPPIKLPRIHTAEVGEIDFSHDGRFLLSGGLDARLLVWDLATQKVYRELRGHAAGSIIYTAKFSPDGKTIASSGTEAKVIVWNIERPAGQELVTTLPLLGGANRLAFSADGSTLAVGSGNRSVVMWSTPDWHKNFELNTLVGIRSVFDFHPLRGDLAFDGENGTIRILPKSDLDAQTFSFPNASMKGMDVYFDAVPAKVGNAEDIEKIVAAPPKC